MKNLLLSSGFSENEAELYLALLEMGEGSIDEILKIASVRRPTAYSVMRGLVDKGLVAEIPGKPIRFRIPSPNQTLNGFIQNKLKDIEQSHEKLLAVSEELVRSAQELYEKAPLAVDEDTDFIILRGVKAIRDALKPLDFNESRKILSRQPRLYKITEANTKEVKESARKGIIQHIICESKMLRLPYFAERAKFFLELGHKVRHLPSVPAKMDILDDSVVFVVMRYNSNPDESITMLVRNRDMVGLFVQAFESLWSTAEPVRIEDIEEALKNAKQESNNE